MKVASYSVREVRENLAAILEKVAAGEHVIITKRRKPIARLIPETEVEAGLVELPYPLRGSLVSMSSDFDEPVEDLWEASSS